MAEYIDKQRIVGILQAKSDMAIGDAKMFYAHAARLVDMLPTDDVAPLVRCKDCKFYDDHYCYANQHGAHEDGFCDEGREKSG